MKTLLVKDIPEAIGDQFKITCQLQKTTIRESIIEFMRKEAGRLSIELKPKE